MGWLQEAELRWIHAISCGETDFQDGLAGYVNDPLFGVPLVVLMVLVAALSARGRSRLPRALLAGLVALGLSHGLREVLWRAAPRPRPSTLFRDDQILRGVSQRRTCAEHPEMWVERGHPPSRASFPSSHVVTAASVAGAVWAASRWVGVAAWVFAVLVGWGRLYWGKHWPTDVLGSLVIGALAAWAGWRLAGPLLDRWARRRAPPAESNPAGGSDVPR